MKTKPLFVFIPIVIAALIAATVAHKVWNQYQARHAIEADYAQAKAVQEQLIGAPLSASDPTFEEKKAYYEMTHNPGEASAKAYYETMQRLHPAHPAASESQ